MKRALTITLAMAVALPLFAEEPKKSDKKTTTASTAQIQEQTSKPVTQQDSPLVAAAKRANRLGKKKTNVITNETLSQYGKNARITTGSENPAALPALGPAPAPTPEMQMDAKRAAERKKAQEADAKAKKLAEEREKKLAYAASQAEEGLYDSDEDDPAAAERAHDEAAKKANERPPEH